MRERVERKIRRLADARDEKAHLRSALDTAHGEALAFAGLDPYSLILDSGTFGSERTPALNLFLPSARQANLFAGVRTAVRVGVEAAEFLGLPLRIISYARMPRTDAAWLPSYVKSEFTFSGTVELVDVFSLDDVTFNDDDVWLTTLWGTAHTLDVLCRRGMVDRARVLYLIQDYEPSFYPASSRSALAATTYHAGFVPIVNSAPLAAYLAEVEGLEVAREAVFRPELDLVRLEQAAEARAARVRSDQRVLLYYRPSSGRNMSEIGMAALHALDAQLGANHTVSLETMGSAHATVRAASSGKVIRAHGRMAWEEYFATLAKADVALSLQATPHPSHPPLDMVVSGGFAVTNRLGSSRKGLHDRYVSERPDPALLAQAVATCLERAQAEPVTALDTSFLKALGNELSEAVGRACRQIGSA